jgi:citrate lyase subunit beta-like protein
MITSPCSYIAVPSSSRKFLDKSRGLKVDNVTYDLEDSVTPGKKAEARTNLREFLKQERASGITEQAVRINAVETGMALDDLTEVVCSPLKSWILVIHMLSSDS